MIKTWQQRCEEHPDHNGIVTERMIQARMQEEIDELRAAIEQPRQWQGLTDEEVLGAGNAAGLKAKMTSNGIIIHPDGIKNFYRAIEARLKERNT